MGLLLTFITGLFFIIGIILNRKFKDNNNISVLAVSLAFVVLLNLILFDIIPEVFQEFNLYSFVFIAIGLFMLKLIDVLIPHHNHNHKEKNDNLKEHSEHLFHISLITILALIIHNIIECMALYNLTNANLNSGILMCIGIAMHNLPLGFQIGSGLKNKKNIYSIIISFSGLLGGIISMVIDNFPIELTSYLMCFTLGMLLYLEIFEFSKELLKERKNKYALYGIIIGIITILISSIL